MDEVMRAYRRAGTVCDLTVIGTGAVSVLATAGAPFLYFATRTVWLSAAVPGAAVILALAAAVLIQRRAVQHHAAVCEAYQASIR